MKTIIFVNIDYHVYGEWFPIVMLVYDIIIIYYNKHHFP